jgi:hypothetical protein
VQGSGALIVNLERIDPHIMAAIATDVQQTTPPAAAGNLEELELEATEERLFLIPQLVGVLRWIEELIVALSGYGIIFALAVGVVDLLTNGELTSQVPWIDYAYAISFAGAIAGQIVGLASRSSRAFSQGHPVRGIAYGVLVILLALTEYQAAVIFGFHKAFGTPVATSLQQLGISESQFIQLRAGVGVFLAVLSGYLRWQPKKAKSLAQLRREAEYKQQVASINAKSRAAGLANLAGFVGNAGKAARAAVEQARQGTLDEGAGVGQADHQDGSGDEEDVKKN